MTVATPTLDRLRAAIAGKTPARHPRPTIPNISERPPLDRILQGEWHETSDGPVFIRDQWYPLDHAHGRFTLGAVLESDPGSLSLLLRAEGAPHPRGYVFFDIETTGLAGGAGTWIVLAGLGSFEVAGPDVPLAFRLRQYFLAGPEYERAMLRMLAEDLERFDAIVTYNGRSFDVPCLESRLTLSRLASPCNSLAHFDLLHAVRGLYMHRMTRCRLADAERRLLRIDRPDDVPGHLIPALYRDYVVGGRPHFLRGVLRHNAEDVISLVGILASLVGIFDHDDIQPDDAVAVARWLEHSAQYDRAIELYRSALPWLEGSDDWNWAAWRYSLLLRRADRREEAVLIWQRLWAQGNAPAGLELAKYYEHHARRLGSARDLVAELMNGAAESETAALAHRLVRIQKKQSRL